MSVTRLKGFNESQNARFLFSIFFFRESETNNEWTMFVLRTHTFTDSISLNVKRIRCEWIYLFVFFFCSALKTLLGRLVRRRLKPNEGEILHLLFVHSKKKKIYEKLLIKVFRTIAPIEMRSGFMWKEPEKKTREEWINNSNNKKTGQSTKVSGSIQ